VLSTRADRRNRVDRQYASVVMTPAYQLETFKNPHPDRDYVIRLEAPEFTCICPLTGQPDFAAFVVEYVPDQLCVELKSFKLYLWSYRDEEAFHEDVTNRVLEDLVAAADPRSIKIEADWRIRGGIRTVITAEHRKDG
jgi:7-cyano-7-deazaguanine reductase